MRLEELDYDLPPELIAQSPLEPRDASRLLVVDRAAGTLAHRRFTDLPALLQPTDLLVLNNSRVLAARLLGHKATTGGRVEALLLRPTGPDVWQALVRPSSRLRVGTELTFGDLSATLRERLGDGLWTVAFSPLGVLDAQLPRLGQMPLPPYIHERLDDPERYQTVYGSQLGSAAAPTAGLHFTPRLLAALAERGIGTAEVTLHVGLDTFRPVQTALVENHPIHREQWHVSPAAAAAIAAARAAGRRVVAVGTTAVRTLETLAARDFAPGSGDTNLFVTPGYEFRCVDALLTNFHLPRTTLIALVAAFAGRALVAEAYAAAIAERYRMLSFGDAMLLL